MEAPKSGYRAEFLEEIAYYEQRYIRLAEAMPTDKYNWRPEESFAHFRSAIVALGEGDADKPQKMFGRSTTLRGSFILVTGHFVEHLGQSIVYARVNRIVPPWTEEVQKSQNKPAEKPKP